MHLRRRAQAPAGACVDGNFVCCVWTNGLALFPLGVSIDDLGAPGIYSSIAKPNTFTYICTHRQEEVESVHPMTLEEIFQRVEVRLAFADGVVGWLADRLVTVSSSD